MRRSLRVLVGVVFLPAYQSLPCHLAILSTSCTADSIAIKVEDFLPQNKMLQCRLVAMKEGHGRCRIERRSTGHKPRRTLCRVDGLELDQVLPAVSPPLFIASIIAERHGRRRNRHCPS